MIPSHKGLLTRLTLLWHFAIALLLLLTSQLPSFDSSAALVLRHRWLTPLLRWDVFHYLHITDDGYVYEYEFAFFPGVPVLMRACKGLMHLSRSYTSTHSIVIVELLTGALASLAISVDTIHTLYDLSRTHLRSTNAALLVSLLSLISSSPATLRFAPYAEPFFTYLSYKGMLFCARRQFTRASIAFGLASFFRSNGTMLSGYVVWGLLVEEVLRDAPSLDIKKLGFKALSSLPLLSLPLLPFVWHQYVGYVQFCDVPPQESRPWCTHRIPLIYSFVQSEYWNVGPFRYWTLQQAPNILLGSPVLALLISGSIWHIQYSLFPCLRRLWRQDRLSKNSEASNETSLDPFLDPSITPHALHALILGVTLLTSAHTQIVLRFASALPFTYWMAARLFLPAPCYDISHDESRKASQAPGRAARWWLGWSMAWGATSIVAWGVFLPPA